MQRSSLSISVFALVVVGLVVLAGGSGYNVVAQEGEADTHPIVGTWQVFLGDSPVVHGLLTHAADGTMTATDPVTTVAPPGSPVSPLFLSSAHGVWEATGPDSAVYTYQQINSDAEGNMLALVTISGVREVNADGQSFTTTGAYTVADPNGNVLDAGPVSGVRGERMAIEPVATPESTPAS